MVPSRLSFYFCILLTILIVFRWYLRHGIRCWCLDSSCKADSRVNDWHCTQSSTTVLVNPVRLTSLQLPALRCAAAVDARQTRQLATLSTPPRLLLLALPGNPLFVREEPHARRQIRPLVLFSVVASHARQHREVARRVSKVGCVSAMSSYYVCAGHNSTYGSRCGMRSELRLA